jgi:hypothetical protein
MFIEERAFRVMVRLFWARKDVDNGSTTKGLWVGPEWVGLPKRELTRTLSCLNRATREERDTVFSLLLAGELVESFSGGNLGHASRSSYRLTDLGMEWVETRLKDARSCTVKGFTRGHLASALKDVADLNTRAGSEPLSCELTSTEELTYVEKVILYLLDRDGVMSDDELSYAAGEFFGQKRLRAGLASLRGKELVEASSGEGDERYWRNTDAAVAILDSL